MPLQSSPPSSSMNQSSLYQFYTPISSSTSNNLSPSSPPCPTSRALQPSTHHNIPSNRRRATLKRTLHAKDQISSTAPAKRIKPVQVAEVIPEVIPVRRHERETITRGIMNRSLNGVRGGLSRCKSHLGIRVNIVTCLHEARYFFSRPIDMHNVQMESGEGTFPFAVQCCNSTPTDLLCKWMLMLANSLMAVSDEAGAVRLLDTAATQETGITKEYIRMQCHDNAVFDISWSADDMKLVKSLVYDLTFWMLMTGDCVG